METKKDRKRGMVAERKIERETEVEEREGEGETGVRQR